MTKKTIKKVVTIFTAGSIVLSTPFIAHKFMSQHRFNFDEISKVADVMVNKASYSRIVDKPALREVKLLQTKDENTNSVSEKEVILEQVKEDITSTENELTAKVQHSNKIDDTTPVETNADTSDLLNNNYRELNNTECFEEAKDEETTKQNEMPSVSQEMNDEGENSAIVSDLPKTEEVEPEENIITPEVKEEPKTEKTPEVKETKPEENAVKPETSKAEDEAKPQENTTTPKAKEQDVQSANSEVESNSQKNEELIKIIQEAVKRTGEADSVYMTRKRTGLYPEDAKIKYSISQNRRWYEDEYLKVEEYIEGFPGRYPTDSTLVRYFYQTRWTKDKQTNEWENKGALYVGHGISELGFLKQIKSVEQLKISCPYPVYVVTLDKEFANKAAENLLNTTNLFKTDVTVTVMLNFEGYIISFDCDWQKGVLNDPKLGPVTITLHLGDFNKTTIQRPKDLNDEPFDYPDWRNVLTQSKKEAIKSSIYAAYDKTYKANNATYTLNGKKVQYDLQTNSALIENTDGSTTYYHGNGAYLDYDFVTPQFQQDSWTKAKNSETWNKNVRKHTCFIPKELYFLTRVFDVIDVQEGADKTTYTIEVLKQYANSAYSYSCNTSDDKFTSNVRFTVSLDKQGYISEIHIDSEGYKVDLVMNNINSTTVARPEGIE